MDFKHIQEMRKSRGEKLALYSETRQELEFKTGMQLHSLIKMFEEAANYLADIKDFSEFSDDELQTMYSRLKHSRESIYNNLSHIKSGAKT